MKPVLFLCRVLVATVALGACTSHESAGARQEALVPRDGLPSYEEQVMLHWLNRVRVEPAPFEAQSVRALIGSEPIVHAATHPLAYDYDLGAAARWQADHIENTACRLCTDHSSCCEIGEVDGVVQCVSEVGGCGVTSRNERFRFFSDRASGENGAQGFRSAQEVIMGWVDSAVHYRSMTSGSFSTVGTGQAGRVHHLVFGGGSEDRVIYSGIHFRDMRREFGPNSFSAAFEPEDQPTFGVAYHLEGGDAPAQARVVVGDSCHDLTLAFGVAHRGTYETAVALDEGCHRYFFHVVDSAGTEHLYPSEGTLGVGIGDAECALYESGRPAANCAGVEPMEPVEPGDGGAGMDAGMGARDSGAGDAAGAPAGDEGGCSVSARAPAAAAVLLAFAWLWRRRRVA